MKDFILNMQDALVYTALFGVASLACAIVAFTLLKRGRSTAAIAAGALTVLLIVVSDVCWCSALYNSGKSLFLLWIDGFPPAFILSIALFGAGAGCIVRGAMQIAKARRAEG